MLVIFATRSKKEAMQIHSMTRMMRNLMLLSLLSSTSQDLYAQQLEWSTPQSFTTSQSKNANPDMRYLGSQNQLFIVWERSENPNSTSVYMRDVLGSDPEIEVLADENIHYTNPVIFPVNPYIGSDTLFFLFYETEAAGVNGIYYLSYLSNGSFTGPSSFFHTGQGETGFDCNNYQKMVWISDGNLYFGSYDPQSATFSNPIMIDSNGCSNPKIGNWVIFWEKESTMGNHIYKSTMTTPNNWSVPVPVYTTAACTNLSKDGFNELGALFTWSVFQDPYWRIMVYISDIQTLTPFGDTPFQPTVTSFGEGCVININDFFISFPAADNGNDEIFINPDPYTPGFINLSQSGSANQNPNFFTGEWVNNCYFLYNIWECEDNGFWQLHYSRRQFCLGSVGENRNGNISVSISPNPFATSLKVSYFLEEQASVRIEVFDLYGRPVETMFTGMQDKGSQVVIWNPGTDPEPGIYFIVIFAGDKIFIEKVVKML
jgi:hypothetical protein